MLLQNVKASHCKSIKLGHLSDTYAANNVLLRYGRVDLPSARKMFDEIPRKDTVTFNTIISSLVTFGHVQTALSFHRSMSASDTGPDARTFSSLLKGIALSAHFNAAQQMHSLSITSGYADDVYVGTALVDVYAKCGRIRDSFRVFEAMQRRNLVTWNALIAGCGKLEDQETAFYLFRLMESVGVLPDDGTMSPLLSLLDSFEFLCTVSQLHCKILKMGLDRQSVVSNALIASYSNCGSLVDARKVFDGFPLKRDLVSFNSLIAACITHQEIDPAIDVFLRMSLDPDVFTFTSVISVCSVERYRDLGEILHGLMVKNGCLSSLQICNALAGMYAGHSMEKALRVFDSIEKKDRVSWNTVLTGFSQNGFHEEAIEFFRIMTCSPVLIDHYAVSASIRSCADLATLQLGQTVHGLGVKLGLETNEYVASSLIFMYYKTGALESAQKTFNESPETIITLNSMIFAYAQHGEGNRALKTFDRMREMRVKMDHITFVAVLTACSHAGFVEKGEWIFISMGSFGVAKRIEHYACMVDMYGRAGMVQKAKRLIETMPMKADAMVWKTMLGFCRGSEELEYGRKIGEIVKEMEPEGHCAYVMMGRIYGEMGKWEEKRRIAKEMRGKSVKKVAGCSWIEIGNRIRVFRAEEGVGIEEEISRVSKGVLGFCLTWDSDLMMLC